MSWRASKAAELLDMAFRSGSMTGAQRIGLFRRAALCADAEGDIKSAIQARDQLLHSSYHTDTDFDQIAAFAWMLGMSERHSEDIDMETLMWLYKWVASALCDFVVIPADMVFRVIDDLDRRHRDAGLSSAPAAQLRVTAAEVMKRYDDLKTYFKVWETNESGAGSDCAACRRAERVYYFYVLGEYDRMLTEATPLRKGTMRCTDVPGTTYPDIAIALFLRDQKEEAEETFKKAIAFLSLNEKHVDKAGGLMRYCAYAGKLEAGYRLISQWMRRFQNSRNDRRKYEFLRGGAALMRAAAKAKVGAIHLTLPPGRAPFDPTGIYDVQEIYDWFNSEACDLAGRFDVRHGNSGHVDAIRADESLINVS